MENQQVASSFQNRAIGCLNGGVASGGSVCRHKGAVARAERRVGGVQLVAAILVMYPWGSVKVLSRRERCCIQHSESSFFAGSGGARDQIAASPGGVSAFVSDDRFFDSSRKKNTTEIMKFW